MELNRIYYHRGSRATGYGIEAWDLFPADP
jgi:hypothetical protein